jgi:hypothetical protein
MDFKKYIKEQGIEILEQLSKEEEKDIIETGHELAKDTLKNKYDKKDVDKKIKEIIKKNKNKDIDAVIEIVTNTFSK